MDKLRTYRSMRRFDRTPEPAGGKAPSADHELTYVVQKHAASRLHYDFRLELDGVLLSWAVPKGPTLDPSEKRLAMRTEDHPIEYGDFEGIIPEGEYGGGTVIVWDRGRWTPEGDARQGLARGRLTFTLDGEKLRGRFHLVKTKGGGKGDPWLLFKSKDEAARAGAELPDKSVLSGRTLDDVRASADRVWHSNRATPKPGTGRARLRKAAAGRRGDLTALIESLPERLPQGLKLTNLDKVLYPNDGLTKGALIAYYAVVGDLMLPHLADRPLTLLRCPDGPHGQCFYQKHAKSSAPASIHRVPIDEDDGVSQYMAVSDLAGLLSLMQLGALEIHTWNCRRDKVDRPDQLVFDIDPDEAIPFGEVREAAFEVRRRLADLELESFVKTTGGKGLHVVMPMARRVGWDDAKEFSHQIALAMTRDSPQRYLADMSKAKRKGKIFIDYLRNGFQASAIAPYSTRARDGATVAAPITWSELEEGVTPAAFTVTTMPGRIAEQKRDPWADVAKTRQTVSRAMIERVRKGKRA